MMKNKMPPDDEWDYDNDSFDYLADLMFGEQSDALKDLFDASQFPATTSTEELDKIFGIQECEHQWQTYQGFNDSFEFCSKCDRKKTHGKF
jgi:hypothetical protein